MRTYRVWEVGVYKPQTIEAPSMYVAVKSFAGTDVDVLRDWLGSMFTNPSRYIATDGSAREFHAREERQ